MRKITIALCLLMAFSFSITGLAKTIELNSADNEFSIVNKSQTELTVFNSVESINTFLVKTNEGVFVQLGMDQYAKNFDIGRPQLPMMKKLIEIPYGADIQVNIISYDEEIIDLNELGITTPIFPVQPSLSKGMDAADAEFMYDVDFYSIDAFNKRPIAEVEYLGKMRGTEIGRFTIAPLRYNPVSNILKVYNNITVQIVFNNADLAATNAEKSRSFSPYFNNNLSKLINYQPVANKDVITQYPVKYVIVADPMFEAQLQPFITWKTKKGFNVVEGYTDAIGTTTTEIQAYLEGLYNAGTVEDPAPTFVLFVGDIDQIPAFSGTAGSHVSDLYYCTFDGAGDIYPEMYYGRFSANDANQLKPQLDKTLEYERYLMPDPAFLGEVIMVSGVDAGMAPVHGNGQINYGTDMYFNAAHSIYSHTYLYGSGTPVTSDQSFAIDSIFADYNAGAGFVNYTAHCSEDGWADPNFGVADVANLTNVHKYPLSIGNCCLSNKFDVSVCYGEALLRANDKGALGHIGGSNNTYWDEDFWWGVGMTTSGDISANPTYAGSGLGAYDCLFHDNGEPESDWFVTNGQIVHSGNLAVTEAGGSEDYYWEIYHLMGDPSVMTWVAVPDAMPVDYFNPVPVGTSALDVTTEAGAYVAISLNGVLLDARLADGTGVANLVFPAFITPDIADVVVTKQFRQPYIGTLDVVSANTGNDAQLTSIISPPANVSTTAPDVAPEFVVRNMGTNSLTTVELGYEIDGGTIVSQSWAGNLAQYETDTVTFPVITLTDGTHTITAFASWPNGVEDEFHPGDTTSKIFSVTAGDAALTQILGIQDVYCDPELVTPSVSVKNNGDVDLTTFDVCYHIDGGSVVTESYTGILAPGASTTINFPQIMLTAGAHTFTSYTTNPNGGADENTGNDTKTFSYLVFESRQKVVIQVNTDDYGSETTWEFTDDATSAVLASGGPYSDYSPETIIEQLCVGEGCYTFTLDDSYGDGQDGWQTDGSYVVSNSTLSQEYGSGGGDWGDQVVVTFCIAVTGVEEVSDKFSIYPNPTTGLIHIHGIVEADTEIEVVDMLGQVVYYQQNNSSSHIIDLSGKAKGVYYVNIRTEKEATVKKIVLSK